MTSKASKPSNLREIDAQSDDDKEVQVAIFV